MQDESNVQASSLDTHSAMKQPRVGAEQPMSCSSGQNRAAAAGSWTKAKAAIALEVREQHGARAAGAGGAELQEWLAGVAQQLEAAEAEFQAARAAFQQADAERATLRDAYRADSKNAAKSAAWHGSVQRAQQAQEAMRAAREGYTQAQALWELLQREAAGRGLQVQASPSAPAGTPVPGAKRRRRNAPSETCPYCQHGYTVRDGLSSKLDGEGNRRHLRRCQCREKTPPCKNCPQCKALPELMAVSDPAEQNRLCQDTYRCAICACKCPGAGKWIEGDAESRRSFAERTEQRHGALSALGWAGGASARLDAGANNCSVGTGAALSGAQGALSWPDKAAAAVAATGAVTMTEHATASAAVAPSVGGLGGGSALDGASPSRGASHPSARHIKRLPADIRSELEQAQQELSTADVLRGWRSSPPSDAAAATGPIQGEPALAPAPAPTSAARAEVVDGSGMGGSAVQQVEKQALQQAAQKAAQQAAQRDVHFHTCAHPHDECTSECCSASHAPEAACGHGNHQHNLNHSHSHCHSLDEHDQGRARQGAERDALPTLAALTVAAQQAQHGGGAGTGARGTLLGLSGGDLAKASVAFHLVQQMLSASGGGLAAGSAIVAGTGLPGGFAQPSPPPELPAEVVALVEEVFLHAAGPYAVQSVCAFLRAQRVTSLSDLEFMELSWLCNALQQPAGLPPLLLNKFLQLGRKRAAAGEAVAGQSAAKQQQAQQPHVSIVQQQQQQHQQQVLTEPGAKTPTLEQQQP